MHAPIRHHGRRCALAVALIALLGAGAAAQVREKTSPIHQQPLPGVDGRTFTAAIVEFPPGGRDVAHRHGDAFVFAYVLHGAVRSQVGDAPARMYQVGETWVEEPGARHVLAENVSSEVPARLLVVFVSRTGEDLRTDEP